MHLRSLKKTRKDVSLHDPIGTDKEGNEITLIDILGSGADDLLLTVDLNIVTTAVLLFIVLAVVISLPEFYSIIITGVLFVSPEVKPAFLAAGRFNVVASTIPATAMMASNW